MMRRPSANLASCSGVGKVPAAALPGPAPPNRCATREASSASSSAFHVLQAAGVRGQRIGLDQRAHQPQHVERGDAVGDEADRALVGQVAPRRHLGQQEVVAHHVLEDGDVVDDEPHPLADRAHDPDADLGVIARIALPDVVEEHAGHEQIRSRHPIDERRRVRRRLAQVTVDREAVEGVALRLAPHRRPFRQDPHEEVTLVERLDHLDRRSSRQQQAREERPGLVGPGRGHIGRGGGQAVERVPLDASVGLGRHGRDAEQQQRVGRGVGRRGDAHAALAQHHLGGENLVVGHPPAAGAAQRGVHPFPDLVARPRDRSGRGADRPHELVGIGIAEHGRHLVLLLEQQSVTGSLGDAVQLDRARRAGRGCWPRAWHRRPRA